MIVFFHNGRKFKQFLNRMIKIGNIELGEFPLLLAPMEDVSDPHSEPFVKQTGLI